MRLIRRGGDDGSILPLTLGYVLLALAAVLVCTDATSMYLAQKQLDALADSAALAGADGFTLSLAGTDATARLTDAGVREQASALIAEVGGGARLVSAGTPDGLSSRVRVAQAWHPPVLTVFVPDGIVLHATATSRTALR
ncbi:hypothetical protein GCM10022240_13410 [Microbacterium kribbense]|uniref:Putative Flp pilus-assembly TadG-like N-terminal domain-containing protein n=1 Tax=Microbacterium kribbense TaxID=433645 RepID=A0ABP7GCK8_9MICO